MTTASHDGHRSFPSGTEDLHRALASLERKMEAVDGYQQLIDATEDPELRRILETSQDREKEDAAMLLEWLRRRDADFAAMLRGIGHEGPRRRRAREHTVPGSTRGVHRDGEQRRARKKG